MSVLVYMLLGLLYGVAFIGLYFLIGHKLGADLYLSIAGVVTGLLAYLFWRLLKKKGPEWFGAL